jgi:microcystin-dependent protein
MSTLAWITPPTVPDDSVICRRLVIPNDPVLVAAVNGALLLLIDPRNWEQISGTVTPAEAAAAMQEMYFAYLRESAFCMIGAIVAVTTAAAPDGTLLCDGSVHSRTDYPHLYAALPSALIVDANTFRTPDLRDRFIVGAGERALHDTGGAASVTLTVEQLPEHSHTTEPHFHTTEPHAHTTEPHAHTTEPHAHTTEPHAHTTEPHSHTTEPHAHGTIPHGHTDAGHVHPEGNTIPVLNEISAGVPVPAAVPSVGVTGLGFASILPSTVDVLPDVVIVDPAGVTVNAASATVNAASVTVNAASVTVYDATVTVNDATVTVNNTGSGAEHDNMPPYYVLAYVMIAR